jgi:hypothetical protein
MQQTQPQIDSDALLERELGEGERLRWASRPQRKKHGGSANVYIVLTIVFGSIGILFLFLATLFLFVLPNPAKFAVCLTFYIIGGVFTYLGLLFGLFAIIFRYAPKNMHYAITDQRVIIMRIGRTLSVSSYYKDDIKQIVRNERADGSGDLIFDGSRPGYNYNYNYSYSYSRSGNSSSSSSSSSSGPYSGGKFINVPDVREAERVLRSTFKHIDPLHY